MKCNKIIPFLLLISSSSVLMAEVGHNEGHDQSMNMAGEAAHWMAPKHEADKQNPVPASDESIQLGKQLFKDNCVTCHGAKADGKGVGAKMFRPGPANLAAMSGMHPDGDFAYKIREGRRAMPAWKNFLGELQVWHLVNYIQSLAVVARVTGTKNYSTHSHTHAHGHSHAHSHGNSPPHTHAHTHTHTHAHPHSNAADNVPLNSAPGAHDH